MLDRLGKATGLLQNSSLSPVRFQEIANQVNGLKKRSQLLENMSTEQARSAAADELILNLVQDIDCFVTKYGTDLLLVPNMSVDWAPGSTNALLDRMKKVSHYVKACNALLTAARRYPIFSHVTFCFVDLQQIRVPRILDRKDLDNALPKDLIPPETILRLAQREKKEPVDMNLLLLERLGHASRLHAEIQLLLYYEMHATALAPRIISSSKSACYLCKLLFELHGKFMVPGSHGHLYDSWKWPAPVSFANNGRTKTTKIDILLPRFMAVIEKKIQDGLEKKMKKSGGDDCESRVSNGSFTATVLSTSSGSSISTIRASRHVRSATLPSLGQSEQQRSSTWPKRSISEQSRSTLRQESTMTDKQGRGIAKDIQNEVELPIRNLTTQIPSTNINPKPETEAQFPQIPKAQPHLPKRQERHDSKGEESWLPEEKPHAMKTINQKQHFLKCPIDRPSNTTTHNKDSRTYPCILQPGNIKLHSFDAIHPTLHIWTPKLHLDLEFSTTRRHSGTPQELQVNIQWLDRTSIGSQEEDMMIVDVNDLSLEGNISMPDSILFSEYGLVVRWKDILIRIWAII